MVNWKKIEEQYLDDPVNFPITKATLNLTRSCNFRCPWCFTHGHGEGNMSFETARKIVDFLFENAKRINDYVEISFWGGEPLLRWELLKEITIYATRKSMQTGIQVRFGGTTNGSLLTPDKFDFLDRYKILFLFSFDGSKKTHDKYRRFSNGEGSYDLCLNNLKEALKKWPIYRTRLSLSADNVDTFFEDMKTMIDLGIDHLIFSPVYETDWNDEKWAIFIEQSKQLVDYIAHLREKGKKVTIEHFVSYVQKDASKWPCGAGRFYCGFDYDGSAGPCHRFLKFDDNRPWYEKEYVIGHIDEKPFITNPEFRYKFLRFYPKCTPDCIGLDTACNGGCYAVNWDFNKDITKPYSQLCKYSVAQKIVSMYYKEKVMDRFHEVSCAPHQGMCQCFNTRFDGINRMIPRNEDIFYKNMLDLLVSINNKLDRLQNENRRYYGKRK